MRRQPVTPTPTPRPPLGNVEAVIAGDHHTCARAAGGGLLCWGWNYNGQLGDGTTVDRTVPVGNGGLASEVSAVNAGWAHTCGITGSDRVAKCWGNNEFGQLGDGTTERRTTPVEVSGLAGGVRAIATGGYHTCAVTAAGGASCWGWNRYGQLGDGTMIGHITPTGVSGLTSGVAALAAGRVHSCALTTSGGVKCWGANMYGQLGDGTRTDRATPMDVVGLAHGVSAIAAGDSSTCALV